MVELFIPIRFWDVIDILLVSYLMYKLYVLIKGTAAINIFIAIFTIYALWLVVKALNMELLGSIIGQVINVGIIALIVIFQQEIRRFLVLIGTRYLSSTFSFNRLFTINFQEEKYYKIKTIVNACQRLSEGQVGALLVLARKSTLDVYAQTGDIINANTSSRLIESIFFKNSPMHDGAMIIVQDKIHAARCILPLSDNPNIPENYGMRHRAALGISESTDALAIVVSEETGEISVADSGKLTHHLGRNELMQLLEHEFAHSSYLRF